MTKQLEHLFSLQCIDNEVNTIKKQIKNKETFKLLKELKIKYDSLKPIQDKNINELAENNKKVVKLNRDLKYLDEKLKEGNDSLYKNQIGIKEIENLQKEIELVHKKIDETENEELRIIDQNEKLNEVIDQNKKNLESYKKEFRDMKSLHIVNDEKIKKELERLGNKRLGILKNIDEILIKQYEDISSKKSNPISVVSKGICTQCGFMLSSMNYDSAKRTDKISLCDHCGRILYLKNS